MLTFKAWKAAGRRVAKGAISVPVTVCVPKKNADKDAATVAEGADRSAVPEAWDNPALVREGTYVAVRCPDCSPLGPTYADDYPTRGGSGVTPQRAG